MLSLWNHRRLAFAARNYRLWRWRQLIQWKSTVMSSMHCTTTSTVHGQ